MSSQAPAAPIVITLPDGSRREYPAPVTAAEVAASISPGLARVAMAATVNGQLVDLHAPIEADAALTIVTPSSPEALMLLRHSAAHLMAQAIKRIRPDAMLEDGPPTEEGFWYDIKTEPPLTPDDFEAIEAEMRKAAKEAHKIVRKELTRDEARELFAARKEKYKLDLIERIPEGDKISIYTQGEFTDLCRGPHVPDTSHIKAFKLTAVSGAYWRGDARNEQLCRVKGTAFLKKEELESHLKMLEEAKARDHRRLGKELDLFMHHEWAPGETFWLPRGRTMYRVLGNAMSELWANEGYLEVFTPMLFKKDLFEASGHWGHYRSNMFIAPGHEANALDDAGIAAWASRLEDEAKRNEAEWKLLAEPMELAATPGQKLSVLLNKSKSIPAKHWEVYEPHPGQFVELRGAEGEIYALKPMNCPSHMLIFRDKKRSYRELPMRIADQGVLHRNEVSGALSGLTRVRQFCQDDGHIFVAQEMIESEITALIALIRRIYAPFGMTFSKVYLSTRPEAYLGEKSMWDAAEAALENALKNNGMNYEINAGDGAFYGPKIDFIVADALKREWQTSTIQLDYQLPIKFGLKYVAKDNSEATPVVIHRAIFGSLERFIGVLTEHFAGWFPVWLAPEQVRILTISEKSDVYANEVLRKLRSNGVRADIDTSADKIGAKIRNGRLMRVPYLLTVGENEARDGSVAVRFHGDQDKGTMPVGNFIEMLAKEQALKF